MIVDFPALVRFVETHGRSLAAGAALRLGVPHVVLVTEEPVANVLSEDGHLGRALTPQDGYAMLVGEFDEGDLERLAALGVGRVVWRALTPLTWSLEIPSFVIRGTDRLPSPPTVSIVTIRPSRAYWLDKRLGIGVRFAIQPRIGSEGHMIHVEGPDGIDTDW